MNRKSEITGLRSTGTVFIDGVELSPARSQAVYNHSPDGFNWGYGGSGPAQLALALLLEATDKFNSQRYYQDFKFAVVSHLDENFVLQASVIYDWLEKRKTEDGRF